MESVLARDALVHNDERVVAFQRSLPCGGSKRVDRENARVLVKSYQLGLVGLYMELTKRRVAGRVDGNV